jgi:hypothetical protein
VVRKVSGLSGVKKILLSPLGAINGEDLRSKGIGRSLVKPVREYRLKEALGDLFNPDTGNAGGGPVKSVSKEHARGGDGGTPQTGRPGVLVVDYTDDNKKLAKRILELGDYAVDLAASGEESITAVCRRDYDLILMDGFEATKAIRAWEKGNKNSRTPIIAKAVLTGAWIGRFNKFLLPGSMRPTFKAPDPYKSERLLS